MALDPNISLGVRPIQFEMPNQLAQYAQISQIQNAQQANQLNQMQMAEYERARREEEGTRNFLAKADLNDPNIRMQLLTGYGKAGREVATNLTAAEKARSEELARQAKLAQDTQVMYQNISGIISNKTDAIGFLQRMVNDPAMKDSPIAKIPLMTQVAKIPEDPQGLDDWKKQFALGATKYITENKPVTFAQDTGVGGRLMARPGLSNGPATVVPGSEFTKGMTFADKNAAARLAFDQSKFAFEKANPTLSIQQTPTGYVAVNTTNGLAIPVLYGQAGFQAAGGAQPAATLGASMMRQPPATLPSQRTPVIPGMASVLDQTAAPVVEPTAAPMALPVGTPGTPVMGKQSELKPIPSNINLAILKNNQSIQQIDETIKLLQQNPSATGVKGYLPGFALNRMDPSGVEARAGVADIGSLVLHDRSGAAVTAAEAPRLVPFIPLPTDDNATVIKKLTRMRNIAAQEQTGLTETYGKDQGYAPNPTVGKTGGAPLSAQQIPPIYATNGKERIMSIDGGQTWTPANK
jgi:hypothetical protein